MKALIIDDEPEICLLIAYQLKKLGIDSSKANTISDGLDKFVPGEYNLVFLDINLPDGNGLDSIPVLKKMDKTLKIVVISAYDTKSEHQKAHELGAYQFLGKPFSKKKIANIASSMVN